MAWPEFSVCLFAYGNFCGTEFAQDLDTASADQDKLELLARQTKIVLRATERVSNQEIARRLGVTAATVGKWRERYRVQG